MPPAPRRTAAPASPIGPARSVRQRLVLLVLAVLIPGVTIGLIGAWTIYEDQRRSVVAAAAETVKALSLVTDREIATRAAVLRALAASPSIDRGDLRAFHGQARAAAPSIDSTIVLADRSGRQLVNTQIAPGSAPLPNGSRPPIGERYDGQTLYVSDLYRTPDGQPHFAVYIPVIRNGELRYMLSMSTRVSNLQRIFEQQPLPRGWTGTVLDAKGTAVARNQNPESIVGRSASPDMLRRLAAEPRGVHQTVTLDGTPVVTVFDRAPDSGWSVLIGLPRAQLRRSALEALSAVLVATLLLSGLAVLAAFRVGRTIAEPVARLQADAEALGRGQRVVETRTGLHETDVVQRLLADASRELLESEQRLQQRVNEAVAESRRAQQAALDAQKLEALGRLTGGIAHDFNNLLQTMSTGIRLASMLATDDKARNALAACERAISKAVTLTRQLMTFGRQQPGRLEVVDLRRQLPALDELLRGALRESIDVTITVDHATAPVEVDPVQLELAVLNLALNARDAIEDAGALTVAAANRRLQADEVAGLPAGDYVAITVTDTGQGIAPELLSRVFEPFFTTKPVGQGSGLGLAQVWGFAQQSGGTAQVASRPGAGTQVTLLLPRSERPPDASSAPRAVPAEQRYRGSVLLVEDDALVRGLTAEALERLGWTVLVAAGVDDAVAIARDRPQLDVVLSDMVMPGGKSGLDLLRALRELVPGLPVVLATGYSDLLSKEMPVPVVAKPYDAGEISRLLQREIDAAAAARG